MKKKISYFAILIFLLTGTSFGLDDMGQTGFYDLDYRFIDNPFSGQKMVTEQDYQKTLSKYQQKAQDKKNKGFWNWVMKHTIPKDKQYTPPNPTPTLYSDEIKYQKEMLTQKPTVALSDSIVDSKGNVVKEGFYQVAYEDLKLKLIQGHDTMGVLDARKTTDTWDENKIIYARVVYQGEDIIKIIYSNLDDCYEAYAYVKRND